MLNYQTVVAAHVLPENLLWNPDDHASTADSPTIGGRDKLRLVGLKSWNLLQLAMPRIQEGIGKLKKHQQVAAFPTVLLHPVKI